MSMVPSSPRKRKRIGNYMFTDKFLGMGSFGTVQQAREIFTNKLVAIKLLKWKNINSTKEKQQIHREIGILKRLDHPNIVKLLDVFELDDITYLVFEYVSNGELFDFLVQNNRLDEKLARKFIRQIISAVEYCHAHLVVHRDLKPENLLLDEDLNIKISDFGLSNFINPNKDFTTFCGSLHYASPEILNGQSYIGPGIDIWSIGVILYCLVVGRQPWDGDTANEVMDSILGDGLNIPPAISDNCADLIENMLKYREEERITIPNIRHNVWINEGFSEPPKSYLPEPDLITEIDETIIQHLIRLGFPEAPSQQSRNAILNGEKIQLVVEYSLLMQLKNKEKAIRDKRLLEEQEQISKFRRTRSGSVSGARSNGSLNFSPPTKTRRRSPRKPKKSGTPKLTCSDVSPRTLVEIDESGELNVKLVKKKKSRSKSKTKKKSRSKHKVVDPPTDLDEVLKFCQERSKARRERRSNTIGSDEQSPVQRTRATPSGDDINEEIFNELVSQRAVTPPRRHRSARSKKRRKSLIKNSPFNSDSGSDPSSCDLIEEEDINDYVGSPRHASRFTTETTSTLKTSKIHKEILRALRELNYGYTRNYHQYIVTTYEVKSKIEFEISVVDIEKFHGKLKGIHLSRISGDWTNVKISCLRLIDELRL
eukprot:TRINITY_DN2866_c0_g2_i1.p1 TRINITY_DN2866_c0_g2~~TRINITY_DN2866_c0_g2_i1.p1  ORF type:complete len:652 (-),score=132.18 TRINITY_DN2866_c0_g2_i1:31-1986(-)